MSFKFNQDSFGNGLGGVGWKGKNLSRLLWVLGFVCGVCGLPSATILLLVRHRVVRELLDTALNTLGVEYCSDEFKLYLVVATPWSKPRC